MRVEDIDDLAGGDTQTVVQPRREGDGAMAEGAVGQSLGNAGLDLLVAAGTPVKVTVLGAALLAAGRGLWLGGGWDDARGLVSGAGGCGAGE